MSLRFFARACALLAACASIPAFASVSLSPSHTDLSYEGIVKLTASVSTGASAQIDIFFDSDQDGAIDSGEQAWRHYVVTDGQAVPPAGARLVTDTDGSANGTISVPIMNFAYDDRIGGRFVVRVKSGSSTSQATFINDLPSYSQSVSGQITLNGTGKAGAAFLLSSSGEHMYPALTDASGKYTLPVPAAGNYQVGGMIINEAGRMSSGTAFSISSGQKKTGVNVAFSAAPYRFKGKTIRSDTSAAVPYAWLECEDEANSKWLIGVSDSSGNFDVGVSSGKWIVTPQAKEQLGTMYGAIGGTTNTLTINDASATGKNFVLAPIAGFVTGRARNGKTLAYIEGAKLVAAEPGANGEVANAMSDASGYWALGVAAGTWTVFPQLDDENDLYKTLLYPSAHFTKTIAAGDAQSVGTIDFLPCDATVKVKVVDGKNAPQQGLYVYGCDQGITNSYQSNAGATDASGFVSVPVRNNGKWFVGAVAQPNPPLHRLDVLAGDGNVLKLYPAGYRLRPYRVYGGNSAPANSDYPQDSGFKLLGKASGTATFSGSYAYYCIVACEGDALVDAVLGSNGVYLGASSSKLTLNAGNIAGRQDKKYATVGDSNGQPQVGSALIHPAAAVSKITVIHPDQPYNAAGAWWGY